MKRDNRKHTELYKLKDTKNFERTIQDEEEMNAIKPFVYTDEADNNNQNIDANNLDVELNP